MLRSASAIPLLRRAMIACKGREQFPDQMRGAVPVQTDTTCGDEINLVQKIVDVVMTLKSGQNQTIMRPSDVNSLIALKGREQFPGQMKGAVPEQTDTLDGDEINLVRKIVDAVMTLKSGQKQTIMHPSDVNSLTARKGREQLPEKMRGAVPVQTDTPGGDAINLVPKIVDADASGDSTFEEDSMENKGLTKPIPEAATDLEVQSWLSRAMHHKDDTN